MNSNLWVIELGITDYEPVLNLQRQLWLKRIIGDVPDVLILAQHNHVITLGRGSTEQSILASQDEIASRNISVHQVERGGDATYHGPGQLVGYPIVKLDGQMRNLSQYVSILEQIMISTLDDFGLWGKPNNNHRGVQVGDKYVGSIGITVKKWATYHGFSLNVNTNLSFFDFINPCGMKPDSMTSMAEELDQELDIYEVAEKMKGHFLQCFGRAKKWKQPVCLV